MHFLEEELRLYAVTDRRWLKGRTLLDCVRDAVDGGATIVQLREKDPDPENLRKEALQIKDLCGSRGVKLLVNDDVALAKEINADGVHLGQDDMDPYTARQILGQEKVIGVTAKTVEQARAAQSAGADYIGVGAVFGTKSKKNAKRITIEQMKKICSAVSIPAVAIGGITAANAGLLTGSGVSGIAVVSALFAQKDIREAARDLRKIADQI